MTEDEQRGHDQSGDGPVAERTSWSWNHPPPGWSTAQSHHVELAAVPVWKVVHTYKSTFFLSIFYLCYYYYCCCSCCCIYIYQPFHFFLLLTLQSFRAGGQTRFQHWCSGRLSSQIPGTIRLDGNHTSFHRIRQKSQSFISKETVQLSVITRAKHTSSFLLFETGRHWLGRYRGETCGRMMTRKRLQNKYIINTKKNVFKYRSRTRHEISFTTDV